MLWPRVQLHELGDQSWCPAWLHHHEQFSLSQLWNLRVPFWSRGSLATQACAVIEEQLRDISSYTIVDICAGAGGPTPFIESELNSKAEAQGKEPVRFVLADMFPPVDVWSAIAKKQPNVEFVERPVDARDVGRLAADDKRECRVFNICFHHFDDMDARGILGSALDEADAFMYGTDRVLLRTLLHENKVANKVAVESSKSLPARSRRASTRLSSSSGASTSHCCGTGTLPCICSSHSSCLSRPWRSGWTGSSRVCARAPQQRFKISLRVQGETLTVGPLAAERRTCSGR